MVSSIAAALSYFSTTKYPYGLPDHLFHFFNLFCNHGSQYLASRYQLLSHCRLTKILAPIFYFLENVELTHIAFIVIQ